MTLYFPNTFYFLHSYNKYIIIYYKYLLFNNFVYSLIHWIIYISSDFSNLNVVCKYNKYTQRKHENQKNFYIIIFYIIIWISENKDKLDDILIILLIYLYYIYIYMYIYVYILYIHFHAKKDWMILIKSRPVKDISIDH